ncbi:MAG: type II toxin-antitoxin system VapC family toxin [Acidimicrobiia bacterium]
MRVYDASAVVDALVSKSWTGVRARRLLAAEPAIRAPEVLSAEVGSTLRRMWREGLIAHFRARAALYQMRRLRVVRYPFEPFAERIWELRERLSPYMAWYVALAERLDVPLVTADQRLARVSGLDCPIEVLPAEPLVVT